ncbi:MAG: glycosyl hydrolase, partial [Pseudomonadota bacterium]
TPLLISPHNSRRIYYAAEYVFRSDDRGSNWQIISSDLTRQLDRNQLDVMGRVWSVDSIAKNDSTSIYGSIIGFSESPIQADLLYAGTDDGVISVSSDGGENWKSVKSFPGVPDMSLVEDLIASSHDANVAYAVFDNHKRGDYRPYVYKTTNQGKSWQSITGNLPERGSAHTIAEDPIDPNLLFVGTEFSLLFSQDGGDNWIKLDGLPTIAVRDIEIQQREHDLVVGTFGRGIYILDDYRALRTSTDAIQQAEATLFQVKDTWLYIEGDRWGTNGVRGYQGDNFFAAENPTFGTRFTYYLNKGVKSRQAQRRETEIKREQDNEDTPYPSWDDLRTEDQEREPSLIIEIRDDSNTVVRRVTTAHKKGLHYVNWDLRLTPPDPVDLNPPKYEGFRSPPMGPLATPGEYSAQLVKRVNGQPIPIGARQSFSLKPLDLSPEITKDRQALQAFQQKTAQLLRAVTGANKRSAELRNRINHLWRALDLTPATSEAQHAKLGGLQSRLDQLDIALTGDKTLRSRNEPAPLSISQRASGIRRNTWKSQSPVTGLHQDAYRIAAQEFDEVVVELGKIGNELSSFEAELGGQETPWTPGRLPDWPPK